MEKIAKKKIITYLLVVAFALATLLVVASNGSLYQGALRLNWSAIGAINCKALAKTVYKVKTGVYVSNVTSKIPSTVVSKVSTNIVSRVASVVVSSVPTRVATGMTVSNVTSRVISKVVSHVASTVSTRVASNVTSQVAAPASYVKACLKASKL